MKERNIFPKEVSDTLKGMLAIVILFSHLHYATEIPFLVFFNKIGTTAVALFFFISGFGLMSSFRKKGKAYLGTIPLLRTWKVFLPMLVVTLLYFLLLYLDGQKIEGNIFARLLWQGITPLPNAWFVFVLMYSYYAFFFAFRWSRTPVEGIIFCGAGLLCFVWWAIEHDYERAWWVCSFAFLAGVVYAQYGTNIRSVTRKWYVSLSLLLSVFVIYIFRERFEWLLILPHCILPLLVVVWLKVGSGTQRAFAWLAEHSYEIYLLHGVAIVLLRGNTIYISSDYIFAASVLLTTLFASRLLHALLTAKPKKVNIVP